MRGREVWKDVIFAPGSQFEREADREMTTLTYCQSKLIENRPMPSLLVAPPKIFVRVVAVLPVAFWAARHFNLQRCQFKKKHIDIDSKITYGN